MKILLSLFGTETIWAFLVSGVFAFTLWVCIQPNQSIPAWLFIIVLFLFLISVLIIGALLVKLSKTTADNLLTINIKTAHIPANSSKPIFLLSPNNLLFIDAYVTIHRLNGYFENYVATGKVINVQSDGFIQVEIFHTEHISIEVLIQPTTLKSLILKHGISSRILDSLHE